MKTRRPIYNNFVINYNKVTYMLFFIAEGIISLDGTCNLTFIIPFRDRPLPRRNCYNYEEDLISYDNASMTFSCTVHT